MGASLSRTPVAGQHAFITGGANGIGLALCKAFLRRGASVSICDYAPSDEAVALLKELIIAEQLPGRVFAVRADVTEYARVCRQILSRHCIIP